MNSKEYIDSKILQIINEKIDHIPEEYKNHPLSIKFLELKNKYEKAKEKVKNIFNYHASQINQIINSTERRFASGNMLIATGEFKYQFDKLEELDSQFEEVYNSWNKIYILDLGSDDEDILEDNLNSFDIEVTNFLKDS